MLLENWLWKTPFYHPLSKIDITAGNYKVQLNITSVNGLRKWRHSMGWAKSLKVGCSLQDGSKGRSCWSCTKRGRVLLRVKILQLAHLSDTNLPDEIHHRENKWQPFPWFCRISIFLFQQPVILREVMLIAFGEISFATLFFFICSFYLDFVSHFTAFWYNIITRLVTNAMKMNYDYFSHIAFVIILLNYLPNPDFQI